MEDRPLGPTRTGPEVTDQRGWPKSHSQPQAHEIASASTPAVPLSTTRDATTPTIDAALTIPSTALPPLSSTAVTSSISSSSSSSTSTVAVHDSTHTMMDVDGADDRARRATSVLSMDDIEAAQALEGLRSDFVYSPQPRQTALPQLQPHQLPPPTTQSDQAPPEPLLSLLTSTHPLISSAINGSMSAYTTSKSYSSRFKYGAEFIERNIGTPVASTVGSVSRKTGVEGGLRWALQRRETNDGNGDRHKRRKTGAGNPNDMDIEKALPEHVDMQRGRSSSDISYSETLPPYDEQRSPTYEEVGNARASDDAARNKTWQSRLMISTSGLGVAMSEESLRRLTYCLKWLKWANGRLSNAILAVKDMLQRWEETGQEKTGAAAVDDAPNRARLSQHIQAVKEDVLRTLKQVVDIVSKYTGGALPENARNLVRRHLMSLPQRFQIASTSTPSPDPAGRSSDEATSAHRVLVLAQEGLDMMAQVSGVVNDTLVSAETWCERLGRKRSNNDSKPDGEASQQPLLLSTQPAMRGVDVKQPILDSSPAPPPSLRDDVHMSGTDGV